MSKIEKLSTKEFSYAVFGMVLGDGCLAKYKKTPKRRILLIEHGPKQEGYARYKAEFLKQHCNMVTVNIKYRGEEKYKITRVYAKFSSGVLRHLNKFERIYLDCGKKIASKYVMRRITPLGLLFWFMDDGTSSVIRLKNKKGYNITSRIFRLSTQGYDNASMKRISDMLFLRFGIENHIQKSGDYTYHTLGVNGMKQFIDVVRPFLSSVPKCMRYKFTMDYDNDLIYSPWGELGTSRVPKFPAPLKVDDDIFQPAQKCVAV